MNPWRDHAVPAMRHEALYGDRVVRCFADRPASLLAMFDAARARRPQHDAVVCEGQRWSYAETGARSERIAAGLAALGIGAGDRVILFLSNRPEFVFVLLAVQRLGAIAVPVGVREQRPGLAYVANQSGAKAIVFDDALVDRIPQRRRGAGAAGSPAGVGTRRDRNGRGSACADRDARDRRGRDPLHLGNDRAIPRARCSPTSRSSIRRCTTRRACA